MKILTIFGIELIKISAAMCPFTKIEKSNKSLHPREEAQCTVQNIPQGLKNPNLI